MTTLGLLERVRGWFGQHGQAIDVERIPARAWTPPVHDEAAMAMLVSSPGAKVVPPREETEEEAASTVNLASPESTAHDEIPCGTRLDDEGHPCSELVNSQSAIRNSQSIDPLDPPWIEAIEALPDRIAQSAAESAAGVRRLELIAGELDGHRQAGRAIAGAVRQLPDLARNQAELTRETHALLERQTALMESTLDAVQALRVSFRSVDEGARRQLKAISELESAHREVLFEYQRMLEATHRRIGWMAAAGIIFAAGAIGAVAYVLYLVWTGGAA